MESAKTETRKTGFGLVNKFLGSSLVTTFKELVKNDEYEELSKADKEFLESVVLKEDRALKAKIYSHDIKKELPEKYKGNTKSKAQKENSLENRNLVDKENEKVL